MNAYVYDCLCGNCQHKDYCEDKKCVANKKPQIITHDENMLEAESIAHDYDN
ncbi:MAG: hypothetical protein J5525_13220 [Lachnospiraceae bacterium]|nr:hypothetical protein [Lachnospiraceae bacterium]